MTTHPLLQRRPQPALIGVVHLLPLPGAPHPGPGLDAVLRRATADAQALAAGGADAVIVENLGDAPFTAGRVDAFTVAALTRCAWAIREVAPDLPLGINILRNDATSALAAAAATGAVFVRVNVLVGAMVTDQGLIEGDARTLLLERRRLGADVGIAADVLVKHAAPLGTRRRVDVARDTFYRGGADALIVSGAGTGLPTDPAHVEEVRDAVPSAPLWLGSGLTPDNAATVTRHLDAAIVGTWLHADGDLRAPVDVRRVTTMKRALDA